MKNLITLLLLLTSSIIYSQMTIGVMAEAGLYTLSDKPYKIDQPNFTYGAGIYHDQIFDNYTFTLEALYHISILDEKIEDETILKITSQYFVSNWIMSYNFVRNDNYKLFAGGGFSLMPRLGYSQESEFIIERLVPIGFNFAAIANLGAVVDRFKISLRTNLGLINIRPEEKLYSSNPITLAIGYTLK